MLSQLLGSATKEYVLVFVVARGQGYAREVAAFFGVSLSSVQKAFDALEAAAVFVSRDVGNTREYQLNPRYPAREQLAALVRRALEFYPSELRERLTHARARPRRRVKPLTPSEPDLRR